MSRRFTVVGLPTACALLLAVAAARCGNAPAAEDILRLVPDSALGLVVVNRPAAVDARLQALGRQMQLPLPGLWAMLKQRSGMQDAWDESGTMGLLILPPPGDHAAPAAVLLVPVTDYGKFVGQLRADGSSRPVANVEVSHRPFCIRSIGGYAALTDAPHREALEKTLALSPDIPAALAPWREWLKEKDYAGLILPPGIKHLSGKAQAGIRFTKSMLVAHGDEQTKAAAGVFDLYARFFQVAEREIAACGIGLQLDPQNVLRLGGRTLLTPGGAWARLVGQERPAHEYLLAGLPAEPFAVAGGGVVSPAVLNALMKLSVDMMQSMHKLYGISPEQAQKLSALSMEGMKGVRSFSMMLGAGKPGDTLFSNAVGAMRVEQDSAFMAAYEKSARQNTELFKGLHSPMLPAPEVTKSEVGGTAALQLTTKVPQPPSGPQMPQQARMMELLFGPGGTVTAWIAPADEHHVAVGYVSKAPLERVLNAIRQGRPGLAGDAGVAKTAALLPAGAVAVAYINPAEMLEYVQRFAAAIMPPQVKVQLKLPEFPHTPPVGWALTTGANELQTCLVVPAEVLEAIGPYVQRCMLAARKDARVTASAQGGSGQPVPPPKAKAADVCGPRPAAPAAVPKPVAAPEPVAVPRRVAAPRREAKPAAETAGKNAAPPHQTVTSTLHCDAPAMEAIEKALASPTSMEFICTPLSDVVEYLKDYHKIDIQLDRKALDQIGVALDTPVTRGLKGVTLASALRLILRDLDLTYMPENEVLLITTQEAADSRLTAVVYPVEDLVTTWDQAGKMWADYDGLIDVITSTARPAGWDSVGGPGSIAPVENRGALVISQTYEVHRQITQLLADLRRLPPAKVLPRPAKPSNTNPGPTKVAPAAGAGGKPAPVRGKPVAG